MIHDDREWSLSRADQIIASEFNEAERDHIKRRGATTLVRSCLAVGILADRNRDPSEADVQAAMAAYVAEPSNDMRDMMRAALISYSRGRL